MLPLLTTLLVCSIGVNSVSAILDCTTIKATPLGDLFRRRASYVTDKDVDEAFVSDQLLKPGWYRTDELDMVSFVPKPWTCGTYNQVWTNSTLPKVGDGIQPLVSCIAVHSNCSTVIQNQVINCGPYRLYHLQPTLAKSGYCFDWSIITPGTVVSEPPTFKPASAEVKYELIFEEGPRRNVAKLKFKCDFNTDPTDAVLHYIVYWYVDGVQIPMFDPVTKDNVDASSITEDSLNNLGVTIKCGVRVKRGEFGKVNGMIISAGFFAGIKIHTPVLTLKRGSTIQLVVEPTVPFGCPLTMGRSLRCKGSKGLKLKLTVPSQNYNCDGVARLAAIDADTCGTYLDGIAQGDHTSTLAWKRNYTIDITTTVDKNMDLTKHMYSVYLSTDLDSSSDHAIWVNYTLKPVQVNIYENVTMWKGKICKAHVDPHMTTADGRGYESQSQGNFTLYKHTTLPMEVQYSTKSCNQNKAQCACAVSVRAGGDIFILDRCGHETFTDFVSCNDLVLDVHALTEKKYTITLPTGTQIKLTLDGYYHDTMDIDIYMSVKDFDSIEGLCGSFNGNTADDYKARNGHVSDETTFINSWRVPADASYLSHKSFKHPTLWPKNLHLCVCHGSQTICSGKESITCHPVHTYPTLKCRIRKDDRIKRRRRWASVPNHHDAYSSRIVKRASPAANMTMAQAEAACMKSFEKHPSYGVKDELTETLSLNASIHECALDVSLTGEMIWAAAHLESWVDNSMALISRNNTFRSISPVIAQEFEENACPSSCSGSGNCANGTCECNDHFIAADCSIDSRTPPRIDHLDSEGVCDWAVEDCCDGLAVYGYPFVQTTMCNMDRTMIYTDGTRYTSPKTTTRAQFRSLDEVLCPIDCKVVPDPAVVGKYPFVSTYDFSVSNDGSHFGQVLTVMVYDSTCQEILNDTTSISFQLKNGSCFINQTCVVNGMPNPKDVCYFCDAENQPYTWTRDTDCDKTAPPTYGGSNHRPRHHSGSSSLYVISHVMFVLMVTLALNLM